ncbi:MAG: hypothetical protein KBT73_05860 [Marinobacter sp.]|nr:hypothetical protein [Marinobacter sp.]
MTLRLGPSYGELCKWALNEKLEYALELSYHILGLNERLIGIPNLVKELSFPESREILAGWSDTPFAGDLLRFSETFNSAERIRDNYWPLIHKGNASLTKSWFKDLSTSTFLLALITHPLDAYQKGEDVAYLRRALRLWLIFHATDRLVRFECSADSDIARVARYLIIDTFDKRWRLIDPILEQVRIRLAGKENSFQRFNNALKNTARHAYEQRKGKGAEYSKFLRSIQNIANGSCDPIRNEARAKVAISHLRSHWRINSIPPESFESDGVVYEVIPSPDFEQNEDATDYLLAEVDPTDSPAQQSLLSGSVLIQTTELSHYLPWSWERLLPPETMALDQWLSSSLTSTALELRLGGAYVWLAMTLSRSLQLLERISIGQTDSQEWSFSPDFRQLTRSAPRRHSGWKPNDICRTSVSPIEERLILDLPHWISPILIEASLNLPTEPANLAELWRGNVKISSERWFNRQMVGQLERITSAKLANQKAQAIFDTSGDYRLARLLTSHPQSALPGACSYATWDLSEIEKGLSLTFKDPETLPKDLNVIGSRLVPFETVLTDEISRATEKLLEATDKGLIHYHNALAQYVVMALYAATGARPLRDPFDSAEQVSLDLACAYITDKNDEGLHSGRLVPLPDGVILLVRHYRQHLELTSQLVAQHRSTLGNNLESLAKGLSAQMPFFFLLDSELKWHSMGDSDALDETLFDWPLPANLFRHRYAQYLSSAGVDCEVIEGWMGHAERGVTTYHDYSPRCWADDANFYRNTINEAYDRLGFFIPDSSPNAPPLIYLPSDNSTYQEPSSFGAKARAQQRKRRLQSAIRTAKDDITVYLGDQSIDDLDDAGLSELSKQMLLRTNQLPHPQAAIRYRLLAKLVARSSINPTRRFRKRLISIGEDHSLLLPTVIRSLEYMPLLQAWAANTRLTAQKSSLSKSKALCVGAALFAIEKRVSYTRLLLDVTKGENFRVIQSGKQFHFEFNESLARSNFSAPVQRHEISYKTASLLAHGLECSQDIAPPSPTDIKELDSLVSLYQKNPHPPSAPTLTNDVFFTWLAETIDQCNLVQLPGMVGAGLSKRLPPTSPSWTDQLRLLHGQTVQRPEGNSPEGRSGLPVEALKRPRKPESEKLTLQIKGKQFADGIRGLLKQYAPSSALETVKHIENLCSDNRSSVSTSLMLLGYWLAARTRRGKSPAGRKFKPYAPNTLLTYWSSMSSVFEQLAYRVDLIALDEDEVTDLCEQLLAFKSETSANTSFFGELLSDFFRWARQFGVESPDWSELDIDEAGRTVSPGLISEDEYQEILTHIHDYSELDSDQRLMMGFVLLCAYRFGLRAREAIALLRKDVCQNADYTWLLIRNNPCRSLKSAASRRAVPLVFDLRPQEQSLLDGVIARYQSLCGSETHRPLLCETNDNVQTRLTSMASQLSASLIIAIRAVTGNHDLVLHHCRHTFFNRVAAALLRLQTPVAQALSMGVNTDLLRRSVLGSNTHCSRRITMALARLMGHRSPRTGLVNYFHLLTEWSDQLTPITHQKIRAIKNVPNVMSWPTEKKSDLKNLGRELVYPKPTLAKLIQTLRLVSLGQSYVRAGNALQLNPDWIIALEAVFQNANNKQSFKSDEDRATWLSGENCPNALLESVIPESWRRMIHYAGELDKAADIMHSDKKWVSLKDLPLLIGRRRHIVFDEQNHIHLIQHLFELFKVPEEQYQVYARFDDAEMIEILLDSGFAVVSETGIMPSAKKPGRLVKYKVALHGFPIPSRRRTTYSHGEIIIHRAAQGILRNGFEMAVALLVTGVYINLNTENPSAMVSGDIR